VEDLMAVAMEGLMVATEGLVAAVMEGRTHASIVGSLDILQGSALRLLVEGKRWNSTYSLFCTF
jgi:hypothetical protein